MSQHSSSPSITEPRGLLRRLRLQSETADTDRLPLLRLAAAVLVALAALGTAGGLLATH
jgi:hypothetical protein